MARQHNKIVDYLTYLLVRVLAMFIYMAGPVGVYRVARVAGDLMYRFDGRHRQIACGHIRLSFPDWNEQRIEHCARLSLQNMVMLAFEVLLTPRCITPMHWPQHLRLNNMAEVLKVLLEQQHGIIMITGHFGNWEIAGYTMATLGFPSVSVARPLDNPYLNEYIMGVRERTGQSILYKKGATMGMNEVLDNKGILCFIADQDAGRKGLFVDFFGRPASTYKSIALMARTHNVPVVVGYGKRVADGFQFEVGVQRIIWPTEWAGQEDEVHWLTQEFSHELETVIRSAPEQYLWLHRRWKHRPDGTKVTGLGVA